MNTTLSDSRRFRLGPGFIAAVILCAWAVPGAQAQHSCDHDRQWKHGSKGAGGMVPDDYLVPMPVDDITRSTPPLGYRVSKSQLQQSQQPPIMGAAGFVSSVEFKYAGNAGSNSGAKKRATTGGAIALPHGDAADWLSGAGGSGFGQMSVSESEHNRLKALQAQAARRKQEAVARQREEMFSHSTVDSGGLIRGIGELK